MNALTRELDGTKKIYVYELAPFAGRLPKLSTTPYPLCGCTVLWGVATHYLYFEEFDDFLKTFPIGILQTALILFKTSDNIPIRKATCFTLLESKSNLSLFEKLLKRFAKPCIFQGCRSRGVPGVPWHPQILTDQLTLAQPRLCPPNNTGTPGFLNLSYGLAFFFCTFVCK